MPSLTTDLLDLLEVQRAQGMAIAPVEVVLPRHRNACGRRRNLEQDHSSLGQFKLMDLSERNSTGSMLGDLQLEVVEIRPM